MQHSLGITHKIEIRLLFLLSFLQNGGSSSKIIVNAVTDHKYLLVTFPFNKDNFSMVCIVCYRKSQTVGRQNGAEVARRCGHAGGGGLIFCWFFFNFFFSFH